MWYLDTIGCSNAMCQDKKAFSQLGESYHNAVKFGDNTSINVMGKGKKSNFKTERNSTQNISNVLYVSILKKNFLSVVQVQEKGYVICIKNGACKVRDEKLRQIANVKMTTNRMFPLYLQNVSHLCLSAKLKDKAWLWHLCYGQASLQ